MVQTTRENPLEGVRQEPAFSPLYQQIRGLLLQRLESGEWKPGEAIPSEMELAARYRVSQGTMRKAIDELAAGNLVVRRQGKGTFVATHAERQVQYRFLRLERDAAGAAPEERPHRTVIECRRVRAPAEVARLLALRSGDAVLQLQRVLAFEGVPTILEDVFLPAAPFKGLTAARLASWSGAMYALFESAFGVRMVRAEEKIRAVGAEAAAARLLQVREGSPLLSVERVAFTYNDVPMELRRGLYRTDARHYRNSLG